MIVAPTPADDEHRLVALRTLEILDTPPEERFDRVTRLATKVLDIPIALVSLVDRDRQWFKSCVGMEGEQTDRSVSFCGHAIAGSSTFVVEDALADRRFFDNPLVLGEPFVRFYAGHPLTSPDGFRVGTLCVIDHVPRRFGDRQLSILRDLATMAEAELRHHDLTLALQGRLEAEDRLRVVTDSVADLVVALEEDGRIVFANRSACTMFGDTVTAPLVGRQVATLLSDLSPAETAELLARAAAGDTSDRLDVVARRADGTTVPLEVTFSPARLDGRHVHIASGRDLTAQRRAQREIEQISQQRRLILASTAEGIVQIDVDGHIVYANPSAHSILALPPDSLAGRHLHSIVQHETCARTTDGWDTCPIRAALLEGPAMKQRDRFCRGDGTTFLGSFTAAPMNDSHQVNGAVLVFADISEQVAVERAKEEFVSMVSHELRTPLTSLKGSLGLVVGGVCGPLPEGVRSMLEVAATNTDRLVRLVNDILDLQRVDAGRLILDLQEHRVADLVCAAVSSVASIFSTSGIALEDDTQNGEDLKICCDGDRIVQVLTNLLGNSGKFSPRDSTVVVRPRATTHHPATVVIDVIDQGRGIPADRLERIFERFEQVDSSDSRHGSGSGLGLAISRALVEQHQGSLSVVSRLGEGSIFTVELPRNGPEEPS